MDIIPDRVEFKRSEVEKITSLSGKVIDYWEGEFAAFFPVIRGGEKYYLHKDVLIILKIKQYLTVDRFNKAEINEKLSGNINLLNKSTVKKTEIKGNLKNSSSENKNKKSLHPIESIPVSKKNKQKINVTEPEEKKKQKKNDVNKLNIIKQDLQEILTILKNNDKKGS